jgi:acetoin utilization deacetylase AcuC-like enzyme
MYLKRYSILIKITTEVVSAYRPLVIVLQSGADSLAGDLIGDFNLTLNGYGECLKIVKGFNLPMILLGGGGYNVPNVARCWTYETALCLDEELPNLIPAEYKFIKEYYNKDRHLHIDPVISI